MKILDCLQANDKTMKANGVEDNIWGKIKTYVEALQTENAAMNERLEKAEVEKSKIKPYIEQDSDGYYRVYTPEWMLLPVLHSISATPEAAKARLREL